LEQIWIIAEYIGWFDYCHARMYVAEPPDRA
jgi:hypothetical protein